MASKQLLKYNYARSITSKILINHNSQQILLFILLTVIGAFSIVSAQSTAAQLAEVVGEQVGQDQRLEIPNGSVFQNIRLYYNQNDRASEITGLQINYLTEAGGQSFSTPLAGSVGNKSVIYAERNGNLFDSFEFERSPTVGMPLYNLMVKSGFFGNGYGVFGAGGQKVVKKLTAPQTFAGLIVRTDGKKVYGLGIIVRGQGAAVATQNSNNVDDPFAAPDSATANPFAETDAPKTQAQQTPIARRPGDSQVTLSNSVQPSNPNQQPRQSSQLFVDFWVEAASKVGHPNPKPDKAAKEIAYWENRYIAPLTIKVQAGTAGSGSIIIENVNGFLDRNNKEDEFNRAPTVGHGTFVLRKLDDTTYQSGSIKAVVKRGEHAGEDLLFLQVPAPWDFLSRTYERAKLPFSLSLSSNRFSAEQQGRKTTRDDSFSTVVKLYLPNLYGYDPSQIHPLQVGVGVKKQIFASSELQDYSFDDELSKGVPYGLKGYNLLTSSNAARTISTSSAVQAQQETSQTMGTNIIGFGAEFAEKFVTTNRNNTSVSTSLSFLKGYSYALIQDFPNAKLHFYFRDQIQTLIDQPNSTDLAPYEKIIEEFGTHYANAITYGGMAYKEVKTTSRESAQSLSEEWKTSLSTEKNGVKADVGSSEGEKNATTNKLEQSEKKWTAIGGSGGFDEGNFQVNDDKLMPVAYDFRPISELVNIVFFPTDGQQKKIMRVLQVRQMLGHAINQKLNSLPPLSRKTRASSSAYKLNITSIKCTQGNNLDRSKIQLSGKFDLKITDSLNTRTENIFNVLIVERKRVQVVKLDCGAEAAEHEINSEFVLVNSIDSPITPTFELISSDLYSYIKPVYTSEEKAALNPFLRDVMSPIGEGILGLFVDRKNTRSTLDTEFRDILLKASHQLIPRTDQKRGVTSADLHAGETAGIIIYGTQNGGNIFVNYTIEKLQ